MANQALTISFVTQSDNAELTVDLDDVLNASTNSGRTSSFIYGDTVYFRVFTKPLTGIIVTAYNSAGTLVDVSIGGTVMEIVVVTEQLVFTQPPSAQGGTLEDQVASLAKPAYSGFTSTAIAGSSSVGSVTLNPNNVQEAMASILGPGVHECSYNAQYSSFSINLATIPVGYSSDVEYPIVVIIVGE